MLSGWSRNATWFLDNRLKAAGLSITRDEEGEFAVNLDILQELLPIPDNTLKTISTVCGEAIAPVCRSVQGTFSNDLETITHLLLELETSTSCDSEEDPSRCETEACGASIDLVGEQSHSARSQTLMVRNQREPSSKERLERIRRRPSSPVEIPIIIPSQHPSVPSIMITPCGSQSHERTCRVPYQDSAFGNLLTVPSHPSFNEIHPPMALGRSSLLPMLENWRWKDGHWEGVVPCLKEQSTRCLFSRMYSTKRRSHRPAAADH